LLGENLVSTGHDISDVGIVVSLFEMDFEGNCVMKVKLSSKCAGIFEVPFAEELDIFLEVMRIKCNTCG